MTNNFQTPGQLLFERLEINWDEVTFEQLSNYTAVEYFLTVEDEPPYDATNLEKVNKYLESFHHLCEVEAWEKAIDVVSVQLNITRHERLHFQLIHWEYYNEEIKIVNKLLGKINQKQDIEIWNILGHIFNLLGKYDKSVQVLKQSLNLAEEIDYRLGKLTSLVYLGAAYNSLGQYEEALQQYQQYSVIAEELNRTRGINTNEIPPLNHLGSYTTPVPIMNLGNIYDSRGDYNTAIQYYLQAWELVENSDDRVSQAQILNNLGNSYTSLEQYYQAIECLNQSLTIAREISLIHCETNALGNLGIVYKSLGEYDRAIEYLQQSLTLARENNNIQSIIINLDKLGDIYTAQGEYDTAIEYIKQSFTNAQEIGDKLGGAISLSGLSLIYYLRGEYQNAIQVCHQSLSIFKEIGNTRREAISLSAMAELMLSRKEYFLRAIPFSLKSLIVAIINGHFNLIGDFVWTPLKILGTIFFIINNKKSLIVYPLVMTLGLYLSWIFSRNLEYQFIYIIVGVLTSICFTSIFLQSKRPKYYYSNQERKRYSKKAREIFSRIYSLKVVGDLFFYDYQQIKSEFKDIYLLYPEDLDICFAYTTLLDWHEENEEAIPILEKALKSSLFYQHSLTAQLAWAITDKGKYENLNRAKYFINKVINLEPENHCFCDTLAWIEYRKRNYKKALKIIEKIIKINHNNPEIYYHAGKIYSELGKKQKSKKYLQKSLSFHRAFSGYQDARELLSTSD